MHLWQPNDIALTPFLGEHITIGGMDFVESTKASLMQALSHRGGSRMSASGSFSTKLVDPCHVRYSPDSDRTADIHWWSRSCQQQI
jgi:hypothetical protein